MRLTPEEIEARRFRLAPNGYECEAVDRFLAEIIDALREDVAAGADGSDEFTRVGKEIAALLRSAHESASAVRAEAEGVAASVRSRAELEATDVRRQAETELEQAKQMLIDAQEKGDLIINEAERQAAAQLASATEQAQARAEQITARAERQAEQIRRGERAAHQRLVAARSDLQQAIDRLAGTDDQPVLDLTTAPPHVRTGGIAGDDEDLGDLGATPVPADADLPVPGEGDPLLRMVRAAVGRAVESSSNEALDQALDEAKPAV